MRIFRKIIFWLHLVLGIVGGIVIFIMCVTGAALSFEKNILEWVEQDQRRVTIGDTRLSTSAILGKVMAARANSRPTSFASQNDPAAAVTVGLGSAGSVFVDPYTGEITGSGSSVTRSFFRFNTDLHRWLVMSGDQRAIGKAITGACNLMFLGLAITGIYIWFPRKLTWKSVRPRAWFRKTSRAKARDLNWHTTIGFWTSLVLVVLTVTAAVISYQWASNLIFTFTGDEPPKPAASPDRASQTPAPFVVPANLDQLWSRAEQRVTTWRSISLRLPLTTEATFTIDEGTALNKFGRGTLNLDAATAETVKWEPYAEKTSASQVRSWMRFMHTGESFGLIGQFIGFVACIGGAVLTYTGVALALRRLAAFLRRRKRASDDLTSADGRLQTLES